MGERSPLWADFTIGGARFWFGSGGKAEAALGTAVAKGVQILERTEDGAFVATDEGTELFLALFAEAVRDWENLRFRGDLVPFSKANIAEVPADLRVTAAVFAHFEWRDLWGNETPPDAQPMDSTQPE